MPMVMKAWTCRAIEASPAGMPTAMAGNRSANWPAYIVPPMATSIPQPIAGRGRKSAGSAAMEKRRTARKTGGKSRSATAMTTKLTPQMIARTTARTMWRGCTEAEPAGWRNAGLCAYPEKKQGGAEKWARALPIRMPCTGRLPGGLPGSK